ncbi:hypothetical protein NFIA_007450 [Paecilomyces variotii No. 5]|uniref:CCHC-type domain-containing protein n=1 Tax=Byssochlamys spectabilis (strain No. 5 / NBRC 109023) TaxID=1356009 RepID=V5I668_BYSSN|nr:hypothetical protein NFIA_007450 [Paecilomyces variotii No. 5]
MGAKPKGSARPPPWPQLDLNIGDEPPKLRAQAQKLYEQITKLKDTAEEKESPPPLDLFVMLADQVRQFAQRVKNEPTLNTVEQEIRSIKDQLNRRLAREDQVFKQLDTLTTQTDRVAAALTPRGSSYRDAALRSHVVSSSESFVTGWNNRVPSTLSPAGSNGLSSTSSPVATPSPSKTDLQVHVKGTTASVVDPLRQKEKELVERANRAIAQSGERMVMHRVVSSGRVLPSGDVILQTDSLEDTEQLTRHDTWVKAFGDHAEIRKRTFPVTMYQVEIDRVHSLAPSALQDQLRADNAGWLAKVPGTITWAGWLLGLKKVRELKDQGQRTSMLNVEFDDDRAARTAVDRGVVFLGKLYSAVAYHKDQRVQQCFRCQAYGHIARHCRRNPRCAYCAGEHDTQVCEDPKNKRTACCAVCKDSLSEKEQMKQPEKLKHFAFSRDCPVRQMKTAIARDIRIHGSPYHAPVARSRSENGAGASIGDVGEDPTPAEAVEGSSKRKSRSISPLKKQANPQLELPPNTLSPATLAGVGSLKKRQSAWTEEESEDEISADMESSFKPLQSSQYEDLADEDTDENDQIE